MGKEQDLMQAAKSGNVAHIEKILGHKARKSGIQSLMSKTINPNHQDELGNTPLHYAALNGHRSSAELLLKYDASTNIPDNNGNYPLHLAAWNGHADVARVLINTGPSRANVNEQNGTEDTALHSAAQFGHSLVVAVLLENHADPYIRNNRQESPLDLAAQYGRMETVKQLLNYHPNLLEDMSAVRSHTSLHLAAKNGHMNVVSYFLSCGMDVNITCSSGTALHEAALFGKADVVNLLLHCGVDVTVVDHNNKTVLDLLASHPSARTTEIRDLIFASSLKEPTCTSSLKRQFTEFQTTKKPFPGIHSSNTFHGFSPNRPTSAVYPRNLHYDDVPNPVPYQKDVASRALRRSGSYDSVPPPRTRQEYLRQSSYDTVPPPKEMTKSSDWTKYDEVEERSPGNIQLSNATKGYSLLGPAEEPAEGAPPQLTPQDIHGGYALIGFPAQGEGNKPSSSLRPDSTYAEVRNEGDSFAPVKKSSPSQADFSDYFLVGSLSDGNESQPLPASGMVSEENSTYFLVGGQPRRDARESYDTVAPKPRAVSQQSIYEVPPPMSLKGGGDGQGNNTIPRQTPPSRMLRRSSSDIYENQQRRATDYDFVALPGRRATPEAPSYDNVSLPSQVPQDQPTNQETPAASTIRPRPQGDKMCPLADAQGYEFVHVRKPEKGTEESAPEMQPFAPLPGYLPMGPAQPDAGYEVLSAPAESQDQLRSYAGEYETLSMAGPQRTGTQTASSARSIPSSAPLYEVPPSMSPPVYEIAPPPKPTSMAPPIPPRQRSGGQSQPSVTGEVQWIEKEPTQPKSPARRQNEYSDWRPAMFGEPGSPARPLSPGRSVTSPKPDAYEQVRIEGPKKGTVDRGRARQITVEHRGGEYCMLSPTAVGPRETEGGETAVAGERLPSLTEPVMTPPFSPPSPRTAEASVFEALGSLRPSNVPTIPEAHEADGDEQRDSKKRQAPIPKPRRNLQNATKPKVLPRHDSLLDEEFDTPADPKRTSGIEVVSQDPFSFPPVVSSSDTSPKDNPKKSNFAELHKRFSPYSSREDIFNYTDDALTNKREEPDGAENESDVKPSPLVYENVLFKRRDEEENGDEATYISNNTTEERHDESAERPDSYRLSKLSADSPMDEREEWEKIEAFLSSIGQIEVPQTIEEQIANAGKAETVPDWLKALDLGQYESSLMANGFDNIRFLNGIIEDEDLLQIGIVDFSHRRTIMEAIKSLPVCPRLSDPDITKPDTLKGWLEWICLPEYFDVFQHNGFTSMDRIHILWEVELTSVLEINLLGHRKRILFSLKEELKETSEQPEDEPLYVSSTQLARQVAELKMYCPDDEKPQAVPTPVAGNADNVMAAAEEIMMNSKEEVKPKTKRKKTSKWRHDPSILIKGSVNYTTLYLGSHAVKTITGLESTIDACRKMRLSTAKLQKIPSVILSVSVKGVKFIDARSKIMVSYHDMKNISYITQDPEDRRVLAYIAKDAKTEKHYCHVFRVDSFALSDEVTMSIGQAFELAFSQFRQALNRRSDQ